MATVKLAFRTHRIFMKFHVSQFVALARSHDSLSLQIYLYL